MEIYISFDDLIEKKVKHKRISTITKYVTNTVLFGIVGMLVIKEIIDKETIVQIGLCNITKKVVKSFL